MLTFFEACRLVIKHCSNPYAVAYARAGLGLEQLDEQKTQAIYILGNTAGWRGDTAREVKAFLRDFYKA